MHCIIMWLATPISYQPHHLATNGPLSDLKPQGSFHVSQSSTVSGHSWYGVVILGDRWSEWTNFLHTACILSEEDCNIEFFMNWVVFTVSQTSINKGVRLCYFVEHKMLNTQSCIYTKKSAFACISINFGEKPYRKMTIKIAIATLIFVTWF